MKHLITSLLIIIGVNTAKAQNCGELMEYVKSKSWGTEYVSYNSDAISKVTFYEITTNYQTLYFAVVCFKKEYSFSCAEYIYQVGANTQTNYSMNYLSSAGKAFWKYIQPYNKNLDCAPNFE